MSFWDFDWAKNTVNATAKWIDRAVSRVTPDIIEKPFTQTQKSVNDYLLKPVIRPALVVAQDAANVFEYVLADNYESVFRRKEYLDRVKRTGAFGYVTELKDQLILGQGTADWGTGFLPGGDAFRQSQQAILENRPQVGDLPFTLGRAGAYPGVKLGLYNQDSILYKIISGGIDAYKTVKNPVDPFNQLPTIRPAGVGPTSRSATAGTKINDKQSFADYFNKLEQQVLTTAEDVSISKRPLTDIERVQASEYNTLTRRVVPTRTVDIPDPLLPGSQKTVPSYEPGNVYDAWRPDVDEFLAGQLNQIGAVREIAPSMIRNNYQTWRQSGAGTKWAQDLIDGVRSGELNAGQIWRTILNREGPQTAAMLVQTLSNPAATIDDVWRVVDEAVASFESGFNLRKIGRSNLDAVRMGDSNVVRYTAQRLGSRQLEILPESTRIGLTDVQQSAVNLDNLMGSFNFGLADRNEWLSRFFVAASGSKDELFTFLRNFEAQAIGEKLRSVTIAGTKRQALPEDVIREITSWTQKIADEIRLYATDDIGNAVPMPWLTGDAIGPVRLTQIMGDDYFLMPPQIVNEVVRLTGKVGAYLESAKGIPVAGRGIAAYDDLRKGLQNYMSAYWKPARVARPSHLIRVVPEEVLRGMASGIYEHPMEQMLAMLTWRGVSPTLGRTVVGQAAKGKIPNIVKLYKQLDELENELIEALRYQDDLNQGLTLTNKQQKLVNQIPDIQKKITDLSAKVDADPQAIWDVLIGPRSRGAMATATGEYAAPYLQMVRRGVMQLPDRNIVAQQNAWLKGVAQEVVDMAYNQDYRRIAQQKLFDDDIITINGVSKSVAGHIADGAMHPYTGSPLVNDLDAVKLWLFSGDGRQYFDAYFDNMANLKPAYKGGGYDNYAVASERVETILVNDIAWVTGFDDTLLQVIATGEFNGARALFRETTGRGRVSPELQKFLKDDFILQPHAPQKVKFFPQRMLQETEFLGGKGFSPVASLQRLWNLYFQEAYGRASDRFARSPTWKASYWNRIEELVPLMTKDDAMQAVQAAKKARLTATRIERLEIQARIANGKGTLEGANLLAEQFATRATNDLLFNMNKRSLFGQQHRILFPFFEAFREVSTTWMKLAAQNPRIVRNVAEFVDSAQTSGTFTTNGEGRQVFELPLTGAVASRLIGSDRQIVRNFTVGVDAVNIALQMRPGFGPVAQIAVDQIAPATPDWDWWRSVASPYGFSSAFESAVPLPPAIAQILAGTKELPVLKDFELFQQFAQALTNYEQNDYKKRATIYSWRFLINNYPDKYVGEDGLSQAYDEAEELANRMTFLRGMLAFAGPGAPMTEWVASTKYGSFEAAIIIDDLRNREDENRKVGLPASKALEDWFATWGEAVWPYMGTITKSNIGGQVASTEFNQWVQQNPELVKKYPLVAGYLGPRTGERSFEAWVQQSQAGRREIKNIEEVAQQAQQRLGNYLYYSEKDRLAAIYNDKQMADPKIRAYLAGKLDEIEQRLPLFAPPGQAGALAQQRNDRQIRQLRAIANNASLQDNPMVQSLKRYFTDLDQSISNLSQFNPTVNVQNWRNVKAAKDLRIHIDTVLAPTIIAENPAFRDVYEQVLSFEFILDED